MFHKAASSWLLLALLAGACCAFEGPPRKYLETMLPEGAQAEEVWYLYEVARDRFEREPPRFKHAVCSTDHDAQTVVCAAFVTAAETRLAGWAERLLWWRRELEVYAATLGFSTRFSAMVLSDPATHDAYAARCHLPWVSVNFEPSWKRAFTRYYACAALFVAAAMAPGRYLGR